MSELTQCNFCSYRSIQERYGKENVSFRHSMGEMRGWIEVNVKGKDEPVAYFMLLAAHCTC